MSLNPLERKAALSLFPYFSREPIIIDIGSNKGSWSDILIHNVSLAILFEPNPNLLTYTRVKYDHLNHIEYRPEAVCDKIEVLPFYNFSRTNNGLSGLFKNEKWNHIPSEIIYVDTTTLDFFLEVELGRCFKNPEIDMVKIDVEGADILVLFGMEQMLTKKIVKFIQIENSEHISLSGHTFMDAIEFMANLGYCCYDFDGDKFFKITEATKSENLYFIIDSFTQDWNKEFIKNTKGLKFDFALEIGAFEGLTTKYICETLLNPGGRIICVDPLTDEYLPGHPDNHLFKGQYDRFIRNTRDLPVELIRKKSDQVWGELKDYRFDFIYVDGDHTAGQVFKDAEMALKLVKLNGFILFDDYQWRKETTDSLDKFLSSFERHITVIHKDYQLMVQKTENYA